MFIPIKSMKSLFSICLPEDLIRDKLSDGTSILLKNSMWKTHVERHASRILCRTLLAPYVIEGSCIDHELEA